MAAVSSLPELTERKRTIDKHTNLATALLGAIQSRHLNEFYNVEEDMLVGKADLSSLQLLLKVCPCCLKPHLNCGHHHHIIHNQRHASKYE